MNAKTALGLMRQTVSDFLSDDAMTLAAGLAFYSALSLAPLLGLFIWITSLLNGAAQQDLVDQIVALVGEEGGRTVRTVVESAEDKPNLGNLTGIIGIGILLFSAGTVFGQLQHSLNVVFDVKSKPVKGAGRALWAWVRRRLLSMGMVLTVGFLLAISLALSAGLAAALGGVRSAMPGTELLWALVDFVAPMIVFIALFAVLFKLLPDVRLAWKDVWLASVVTAVLFSVGKIGIGLYLGRSSLASAYGAAGSLIVLLVWVYYSASIFLFGAELTQVWSRAHGRGFEPKEGAEAIAQPDQRARPDPDEPPLLRPPADRDPEDLTARQSIGRRAGRAGRYPRAVRPPGRAIADAVHETQSRPWAFIAVAFKAGLLLGATFKRR
jgi:membrane protein